MDCGCETPGCCGSPIIIDVNRTGYHLTDVTHGVSFDFFGTGHSIHMSWTAPGEANAFLVLPATDGLVHNGKQLFGNITPQPTSNDPNGFRALAVYDQPENGGNGDGVIDSRDAIFSSLRLWIDADHDGICQQEELHTLPSLGVYSIDLRYHLSGRKDRYGNQFRYVGSINVEDPNSSTVESRIYDVMLRIARASLPEVHP